LYWHLCHLIFLWPLSQIPVNALADNPDSHRPPENAHSRC
jgi:hypothetical protein